VLGKDYYVPKHKIGEEYNYRALGEQNIADARWRQLMPPSSFATTSYQYLDPAATTTATATAWAPTHHHASVNPLALDNGNAEQFSNWLVPTKPSDVDSGFYSAGGGDGFGHTSATTAAAAPDDGHYYADLNPVPQDVANNDREVNMYWFGPAQGSSVECTPASPDINFDAELGGHDSIDGGNQTIDDGN
jgi:hypothetical protein